MTQIKRAVTYAGIASDIGNTGNLAHRGEPNIYICQPGKNVDPLFVEGGFTVGRPINVPDFMKQIDEEKIKAGYPKNYLYSIPIGEEMELKFTFDHWKPYLGNQLLLGDVAIGVNKATAGQTTIASSSTKYSATLTDATGIKAGDWCLVDTVHATYGGFPEIAIIKSVSGNNVTFEGLTNAAAVGAAFEKLKGNTTGTNKSNTGLHLAPSLTVNYQVYHTIFHIPLVSSKSQLIVSVPELEIKPDMGIPNFNQTLSQISFTGRPRMQAEKSFTLVDGTTENRPWCMEAWLIPYESA